MTPSAVLSISNDMVGGGGGGVLREMAKAPIWLNTLPFVWLNKHSYNIHVFIQQPSECSQFSRTWYVRYLDLSTTPQECCNHEMTCPNTFYKQISWACDDGA